MPKFRRRDTIKNSTEISKIETRKTVRKISETKNWFISKINKTHKPFIIPLENERRLK